MFPLRWRGCCPSFRLALRSRRFRRSERWLSARSRRLGCGRSLGCSWARDGPGFHITLALTVSSPVRAGGADRVGLTLASMICERLLESGELVVVAVDDSLFGRVGSKVHACSWHRDVTGHRGRMVARWGNSWVVAGIVLRLPFLDRPVCLPVLFRLWRPKRKQFGKKQSDPERPGKPALARQMIDLLSERLPDRALRVLGDSAYAGRSWRGLEDRITIIFRLRQQAALYAPAPPTSGRRGRPRSWGPKLGSVAQLATDPDSRWASTTVHWYERTQTVRFLTVEGLWEPLEPDTPVRVIIVREHNRPKDKPAARYSAPPSSTQPPRRRSSAMPITGPSRSAFNRQSNCSASVTPATEPSTPSSGPSRSSS